MARIMWLSLKNQMFFLHPYLVPPPNADESPPPFGFWTRTIRISNMHVITISIVKL